MVANRFVGRITCVGRSRTIERLVGEPSPIALQPLGATVDDEPSSGTIVLAELRGETATILETLATPGGARCDLYRIVASLELDPVFPDEVMQEARALLEAPGIDDSSLVDLTHLLFVTIDAPTSRDLDQALFVELAFEASHPARYRLHYALADAAHFVPPRSALFREALRRGASYYLPGLSVPMLPRELSEGIVSLNPEVDRRALVFSIDLDAEGRRVSTEIVRARVRSRHKLAFGEVERFYDAPEESSLSSTDVAESLSLLREVGRLLMKVASARHVVRYARREVDVGVAPGGGAFVVAEEPRLETELYNEQVSLLCNAEGARILLEGASPDIQPIYRVHPDPDEARLRIFGELTVAIAECHGLDPRVWAFRVDDPTELLADYLLRLRPDPSESATPTLQHRVGRALQRQAVLVNVRSTYASDPSKHFGVGADVYARFSAPMREVVGIFLHKELVELEALRGRRVGQADAEAREVDEALRLQVIDAANRSKDTQRKVNDQVNRLVLDRLFVDDLATPLDKRPRRPGTVMGITSSKVHVALDAPAVDVKLYVRDIGRARGGAWLELRRDGVELFDTNAGTSVLRLGDLVSLVVERRDDAQDRWVIVVDSTPSRT